MVLLGECLPVSKPPLNLSAPCPPARETCDKIRAYLISLLGGQLPPQVVLCIPAQCTEAWLFAALHPELLILFQPIECREEVAKLLINKPEKLVRDKEGRARKQPEKYRDTSPKVVKQWPQATASCAEALRFETECRAALPK